jgi:hypothetical protein
MEDQQKKGRQADPLHGQAAEGEDMKPKTIKLAPGESIIAVVPDRCAGPGWANAPTWVYIKTNAGRLREECIQPEERTPELHTLHYAGFAMCSALLDAVPTKKVKT